MSGNIPTDAELLWGFGHVAYNKLLLAIPDETTLNMLKQLHGTTANIETSDGTVHPDQWVAVKNLLQAIEAVQQAKARYEFAWQNRKETK